MVDFRSNCSALEPWQPQIAEIFGQSPVIKEISMLVRSQVYTLLTSKNGFFALLPKDIIHLIQNSPTPDPDFLITLKNVGNGNLKEVKEKLDKTQSDKKELMRLLIQAGNVVTRSGLQVMGKTLLEVAIGEGDWEMIKLIKTYFLKFEGGQQECESQVERYRPCIQAIATQKPDDLSELFKIIKRSLPQEILEELKTGNHYNWEFQSDVRSALNEFRAKKLDPKLRIITKPRMHCNYQNVKHIYDMIYKEWGSLTAGNYYKLYLVLRQILGLTQVVEFPAYERYVYARGQIDAAMAGEPIERSLEYKQQQGQFFPDFNLDNINFHSGVGFNSYIDMFGLCSLEAGKAGNTPVFEKLCQTKILHLNELCDVQSNENISVYDFLICKYF